MNTLDQWTDEELAEGLRALEAFKAAPRAVRLRMLALLEVPKTDTAMWEWAEKIGE